MRLELVPLILEIFAGKVELHADFVAQRLEVREAGLQVLLQIGRGVAHDVASCLGLLRIRDQRSMFYPRSGLSPRRLRWVERSTAKRRGCVAHTCLAPGERTLRSIERSTAPRQTLRRRPRRHERCWFLAMSKPM